MKWVSACLRHKLAIYLIALALSLLGLFCIFVIPITPFPLPPSHSIEVKFSYPGANATAVQTQVVQKVSNALRSLNNIQYITATSQADQATIQLELSSFTQQEILQTQIKIIQAISSANLPSSVPQPQIITSMNESGLIQFVVTSNKWSLFELDNFIQSSMAPSFSSIPGVTLETTNQTPEVKIKLIPEKLAAYHLAAYDIAQLLDNTYHTNPLGALHIQHHSYELSLQNPINSLQAFHHLVIGYQQGNSAEPIYLKDIADVSFEPQNVDSTYYSSYNGQLADSIGLLTHGISNPFYAAKVSKEYVQQLKQHLPNWIHIYTTRDKSAVMWNAIYEVIFTICIATILVLMIALIFLGHLRTTIIPIITVPICLLGTIAVISGLGYSINLLTLLALVIAVGLVVDDAIVVVENITRHLELGMNKLDAIMHGTSDIALTVIGITATLLAVYLPITFCTGAFVDFLRAFAVPLATAVFISGILALTLTPIMAVTFISDAPQNTYQHSFNHVLNAAISLQHRILNGLLKTPMAALLAIVLLIIIGGYYSLQLPSSYFAKDPSSEVDITINGTPVDTVQSLQQKSTQFKSFYNNNTVKYYNVGIDKDQTSGLLTATISITYKIKYLHQNAEFAALINRYIKRHNLQNSYAKMEKFLNSGSMADVSFYLYGNTTPAALSRAALRLTQIMQKSSQFSNVTNITNEPHKQLEFQIDTIKAAKFGILRTQIAHLLSTYFGGYQLENYFNIDGLTVPVVVQLDTPDLKDPQSIEKLLLFSPTIKQYLPLDEFVHFKTVAKPEQVTTFNNQPSVIIMANLAKGFSTGSAIRYIDNLLLNKVPTLQHQYVGPAKDYLEGNAQTKLIIILGLICVYFLLAILFGNLADPFIIMLTVPFSVVGGALSLYLIDGSLNIFSVLGLITLIGLITKHGVLIVQFANQELKTKQCGVRNAILTATHHRFRPIMMTTLAMTLGALPLVLSSDYMYAGRRELGIVIIGGLVIGTLFSLFIVPLVYSLIKRAEHISSN